MANGRRAWNSHLRGNLRFVLGCVVGLVLLYPGVVHALQPYYFMQSVAAYQLLPRWSIGLVGAIAPSLQIVLGISIIFSFAPRTALACATVLFTVFAAAQATVLWRGIEIDCGCFGFSSSSVTAYSLAIPSSMFAACILLLVETNKNVIRDRVRVNEP